MANYDKNSFQNILFGFLEIIYESVNLKGAVHN